MLVCSTSKSDLRSILKCGQNRIIDILNLVTPKDEAKHELASEAALLNI
jgi:hypothetical protein